MAEISREDVGMAGGNEGGEGGAPKPDKPVFNPSAVPPAQNPEDQPGAAGGPPGGLSGSDTGAPDLEGQPTAPDLDAFSFPDHESVPELLRGKKGSEAIGAWNTLFQTSQQMANYLRQMQQTPPQQQTQQTPPEPLFGQDDFITGDPGTIQQKIEKLFEQKAGPLIADVYRNLSFQQMNTARTTLPHFTKYEAEIMQEVGHLPINYTANFQVWKDAHDRVVSRHIDEIARERASRRPAPPVTERGGSNLPAGSPTGELTADQIRIANGLGVPIETFKKYAEAYNRNAGRI